MLYLFAEANAEAIQEQITRYDILMIYLTNDNGLNIFICKNECNYLCGDKVLRFQSLPSQHRTACFRRNYQRGHELIN